jgi:hypothetical protein
MFFGNIYYSLTQNITANMRLSYGGYGKTAVGLGIWSKLGKSWQAYLQTNNIEGILLPKTFGGLSLQLGIAKKL